MVHDEEIVLKRGCPATVIPAGDAVVLPSGAHVVITRNLGGSVTVRALGNLFRIARPDFDLACGESARTAGQHEMSSAGSVAGEVGGLNDDQILEALRDCLDPEIPINIVDLGLVYDLAIEQRENGRYAVKVKMTLTAQGCGMGHIIASDAKSRIEALPQVEEAVVDIVWDPAWTPQMISDEGRKKLGLV